VLLGCGVAALIAAVTLRSAAGGTANVRGAALEPFRATGFSVDLPCRPKPVSRTQHTSLGSVTVVGYACAAGGDGYGVAATTVPGRHSGTVDITAAAKGAANNLGGTATDLTTTTYQGHPAADLRVPNARAGTRPVTVFMRVIDTGSTLYELQYQQDGGNVPAPPANYAAFLASLHIG
jgi:hypothetical protein